MPDPVSQRAELQRWWKKNQVHFEQEDYKAVKPGLPIASVFEVEDENRRKDGLPPLERPGAIQPAPMPLPERPLPESSTRPTAEPASSSKVLFCTGAALAALLAGALAVYARRRRQ